jgi:hypothetical protein
MLRYQPRPRGSSGWRPMANAGNSSCPLPYSDGRFNKIFAVRTNCGLWTTVDRDVSLKVSEGRIARLQRTPRE